MIGTHVIVDPMTWLIQMDRSPLEQLTHAGPRLKSQLMKVQELHSRRYVIDGQSQAFPTEVLIGLRVSEL